MLRRLIVLCACLLAAAPAAADEVLLTNGDRLTGTVVALSASTLTVTTPHGPLKIAWASVAGLVVTDPILVTVARQPAASVRIAAGEGPGRVRLDPGGPVELTQIVALARPQPAVTVAGGANAGFLQTSGNTDVSSLRLDGDIAIREHDNRYRGSASLNRAEDAGRDTAENWNTAFNYDRFLTTRLFVNGNAIFTNDRFRDLDLRTALGAGLGYQVLNTALVQLTANAGLGWVNENFDAGADDSYTAARESAALDVFVAARRMQLFHQHDGYFGLTGEDNLFVRMKNGVRLGLFGGLVTTLTHDIDYDRSPSPGRKNTDRTLALTFGYRF
jgi:putative salt-induced outer membrane protein YdiY